MIREIVFVACLTQCRRNQFARRDVKIRNEAYSPMSGVFEFTLFYLTGRRWFRRSYSFQGLDSCLLIATDDVGAVALFELLRRLVDFADFRSLLSECFEVFDFGIQPITTQVRA